MGIPSTAYVHHPHKNCYGLHGANPLGENHMQSGSLDTAKETCSADTRCEGFVFLDGSNNFWLRKEIYIGYCDHNPNFSMYINAATIREIHIHTGLVVTRGLYT